MFAFLQTVPVVRGGSVIAPDSYVPNVNSEVSDPRGDVYQYELAHLRATGGTLRPRKGFQQVMALVDKDTIDFDIPTN
jgi:hypothetical protein